MYSDPSKTKKLLKYIFDFPWPIAERHCVLDFFARPRENSLLIVYYTPEYKKYFDFDIPEPAPGETRMRVNIGSIFVEYLNENQTKLTILTSADGNIVIYM